MRIGEGHDIHRLEPGGPLRVGCIDVPAEVSAVGHSDGDSAAHALCDALLGALALGDIGTHFPPGDPRWKGKHSAHFLAAVAEMYRERGARISNVDLTVVLEAPKLRTHIPAMRAALAEALGIDVERVSVKAKTYEGMGPVGEGMAIEAHAVALVDVAGQS